MHSVGEMLRREREGQQRTIQQIATETCIPRRYLEAIEENNVKILPGGFFYKSFVRQYAEALGIDFSEMESAVDLNMPVEEEDVLPALTHAAGDRNASWLSIDLGSLYLAGFTCAAILLGCVVTYVLWSNVISRRVGVLSSPPSASGVAVAAPVQATHPPVVEERVAPASGEAAAGRISLEMAATEKTWVSLVADGKPIFRGVLGPRQTKTLESSEKAKLLTRNAGGLEIRFNGKPIGPIGSRGQFRMLVFTPDDYKVFGRTKM